MPSRTKTITLSVVLVLIGIALAWVMVSGGHVTIRGKRYGVAGMLRGTAVAATVNGEVIYARELDSEVNAIAKQYGMDLSTKDGANQRAEISRIVLDQMIEQRLVKQEASRRNVLATDAQVDAQIAEIKRNFSSENEFQSALAQRELTLTDLRNRLRTNLTVRNLMVQVTSVSAGDAEVGKYFQEHRSEFDRPEQIHVKHILVESEAEARLILAKLRRGEKFEDLARQYSKDPGSKTQGGDLGFIGRGQVVGEFERVAFALQPGQTSEIVKSQYGYHIIQVVERRAPQPAALDQVRDQIRAQLLAKKQDEAFQEWLKQVKVQARITRSDRPTK